MFSRYCSHLFCYSGSSLLITSQSEGYVSHPFRLLTHIRMPSWSMWNTEVVVGKAKWQQIKVLIYLWCVLVLQWFRVITAIGTFPKWPFEMTGVLSVNAATCLILVGNLLLVSLLVQQLCPGRSRAITAFSSHLLISLSCLLSSECKTEAPEMVAFLKTSVHKETNLRQVPQG